MYIMSDTANDEDRHHTRSGPAPPSHPPFIGYLAMAMTLRQAVCSRPCLESPLGCAARAPIPGRSRLAGRAGLSKWAAGTLLQTTPGPRQPCRGGRPAPRCGGRMHGQTPRLVKASGQRAGVVKVSGQGAGAAVRVARRQARRAHPHPPTGGSMVGVVIGLVGVR